MLDPETYRTVLETLPNGVYLVDRDRRILFWNNGAERITGYMRHEVIGRHCQDDLLMHCDSQRNLLCGSGCPLTATMHDGQPRQADVLLRHRSGERVPVRVRAVPLRDEQGVIIGAIESFDEPFSGVEPDDGRAAMASGERDELTGLPLQASVESRLTEAVADAAGRKIPCGVLMVAIDRLEQFRHAYGVLAGDALIRSTAHTLAHNLHPGAIVGRWSPERFVAVCNGYSEAELLSAAERLQRIVGMATISWWGDRLSATISVGAATVRPEDTAGSLISRSEETLQRCQAEGGDRIACG